MTSQWITQAGVDELVDRLHRDGVEAGRQEAERLVETARAEADALLTAARAERDRLLAEAKREVEALRRSSEAALGLAMRDTLLRTREALTALIVDRLGSRVREALLQPEALAELIGWAAQQMVGEGKLTAEVGGVEHRSGALAALADQLCSDLAEQRPELQMDGIRPGVVLRREGETIALEFTDETITAFLFARMQPRFRKIFEGARLD